jgi:hypothetical protein
MGPRPPQGATAHSLACHAAGDGLRSLNQQTSFPEHHRVPRRPALERNRSPAVVVLVSPGGDVAADLRRGRNAPGRSYFTPQVTPRAESRESSIPSGCQTRRSELPWGRDSISRRTLVNPATTGAPGQSSTPAGSIVRSTAGARPESLLSS